MCKVLSDYGRFKMFKRTEGVSTTDIVGKLLHLTEDNSSQGKEVRKIENEESKKE